MAKANSASNAESNSSAIAVMPEKGEVTTLEERNAIRIANRLGALETQEKEGSVTYSNDQLAELPSYEQLMMALSQNESLTSQDLGDGFETIDDPECLVGEPFIFLDWRFFEGDHDKPYIFARAVTAHDRKVKFSYGGVGIPDQLAEIASKGQTHSFPCLRGLVRSRREEKDSYSYFIAT